MLALIALTDHGGFLRSIAVVISPAEAAANERTTRPGGARCEPALPYIRSYAYVTRSIGRPGGQLARRAVFLAAIDRLPVSAAPYQGRPAYAHQDFLMPTYQGCRMRRLLPRASTQHYFFFRCSVRHSKRGSGLGQEAHRMRTLSGRGCSAPRGPQLCSRYSPGRSSSSETGLGNSTAYLLFAAPRIHTDQLRRGTPPTYGRLARGTSTWQLDSGCVGRP